MAQDSLTVRRFLDDSSRKLSDLFNKASSGKRINKAADDAAGLAIASQLASDEKLYSQANRNIADSQSALQVADGANEQLTNISTRMSELAAQASNGTLSDTQRQSLDQEFQALKQEAQRIQETTTFNGQNVLTNSFTSQAGIDSSANSQISVSGSTASVPSASLTSQASAQAALETVSSFRDSVAQARGNAGAVDARLSVAAENNSIAKENVAAARSRIEDADIGEVAAGLQNESTRQKIASKVFKQAADEDKKNLLLLKA